jgi:hypothetical protein
MEIKQKSKRNKDKATAALYGHSRPPEDHAAPCGPMRPHATPKSSPKSMRPPCPPRPPNVCSGPVRLFVAPQGSSWPPSAPRSFPGRLAAARALSRVSLGPRPPCDFPQPTKTPMAPHSLLRPPAAPMVSCGPQRSLAVLWHIAAPRGD